MPALSNAKWEAAAQDYVLNGNDKSAAYRKGFTKAKGKPETIHAKAYQLFKRDVVWIRVLELQEIASKAAENNFSVTTEWKQKMLVEVAERSMQHEQATDEEGNNIGDFKFDGGTAVRAIDQLNKMDGGHSPVKTKELTPPTIVINRPNGN